jgi:hypothetical protein
MNAAARLALAREISDLVQAIRDSQATRPLERKGVRGELEEGGGTGIRGERVVHGL